MVVFEPAKGNFMFIMDSLDIVDANVTLGGCLGYLKKKNIFRDDGSTKLSCDDGHMMVLRKKGYISRRWIHEVIS